MGNFTLVQIKRSRLDLAQSFELKETPQEINCRKLIVVFPFRKWYFYMRNIALLR
jgi:hypothetical protein